MSYIVYTTMWSEGEVVAHTDDKLFAIGYDPITGNVVYKTYEELKTFTSFRILAQFENAGYISMFDTALYPRKR